MPTSHFGPLPLLLSIFVAMYGLIVVHELAHAAVAALAGLRVPACGVGCGRPLVKLRLWGTVFYQTAVPLGGLTFILPQRGWGQPTARALAIAAGPLMDLTVAAAMLVLWSLGFREGWIAPAFYVACFCALIDVIPFSGRVQGIDFRNDGGQVVNILRGRLDDPPEIIAALRSCLNLRQFARMLGAWEVEIFSTLAIAACQSELADAHGAAETLCDPCLSDPRRGDLLREYETVVRAAIAAQAHDETAPAQLAEALHIWQDEPRLLARLRVAALEFEVRRGVAAVERIDALIAEAHREVNRFVEQSARALRLVVEPPDDPAAAYEAFVRDLARPEARRPLRLFVAQEMTALLARRGAAEPARRLFRDALALVRSLAAEIPSETTRQRFAQDHARRLHEAVAPLDRPDELPWYVDLTPPPKPPASRAVPFVAGILCGVLLAMGVVALAITLANPDSSDDHHPPPGAAGSASASASPRSMAPAEPAAPGAPGVSDGQTA